MVRRDVAACEICWCEGGRECARYTSGGIVAASIVRVGGVWVKDGEDTSVLSVLRAKEIKSSSTVSGVRFSLVAGAFTILR
jgi:hypothetical protein